MTRYHGRKLNGDTADGYSSCSTSGSGGVNGQMKNGDRFGYFKARTRSVLYSFDPINLNLQPIDLPVAVKIKQVLLFIIDDGILF